jgi:hypothetical protein
MVQRILARQQSGNGTGTSPEMTVADAVAYIARQLDLDPNQVMATIIDLVKQRPAKLPTAPNHVDADDGKSHSNDVCAK